MLNAVKCDNGMIHELVKAGWGQLTMRTIHPGCQTTGHRHPNTIERWVLVGGRAKATLILPDGPGAFSVHLDAERPELVEVPVGTWHSVRNVGDTDATLIVWASKWYEDQEKTE